eukprot:3203268-Rhodomonas_salina.1
MHSSNIARQAGELGWLMLTGGEERRHWMGLHWLTATGPYRTQTAGDADPHYVQTLDAYASEMGYGNSGGLDGGRSRVSAREWQTRS